MFMTQKIDTKMTIFHCALILAFAILLENVYCDSSNPLPNSPLNYLSSLPKPKAQVTSYLLVASWPAWFCTEDSGHTCQIEPVPTNFTIHGLWQQPRGAGVPSKETFDRDEIDDLKEQLHLNWPNLTSNDPDGNFKFWEHEWKRHEDYSGLGMHAWFNKTLELFNATVKGLKAEPEDREITPSNSKTYRLTEIEAAVIDFTGGFNATIICGQRNDHSNTQQIKEIQFNYTLDFKKMNTSSASKCNPDDEILFPAPPPSDPEILCPAPAPGFGLTEVVSVPDSTTSTTPFHLLWLVYYLL